MWEILVQIAELVLAKVCNLSLQSAFMPDNW